MLDSINGVFARINEIKSGGKALSTSLKPEKVVDFENGLRERLSNNNSNKKESVDNIHPFLKSKKSLFEMSENQRLEKDSFDNKNKDIDAINSSVKKYSKKYDVPEELIRAVIRVESNYDKNAVSRVGAMGLMQLMPKTALELSVDKPFDIDENINGGTKYLKMMIDKYDGDLDKVLSAYNAGPTAVDNANGIPNFEETQNYVKSIRKILNR